MAKWCNNLAFRWLVVVWLPWMGSSVHANEMAAVVTHLSGTLSARLADGTLKLLSVRSEVSEGDVLTTEKETYARLKFRDGSEVVMRPSAQLAISKFKYSEADPKSDATSLNLLKGGLRMVTGLLGKRSPEQVSVKTTAATIGIRGTHFGLLMCNGDCKDVPTVSGTPPQDGLYADVAFGAVMISNEAGVQRVETGQFAHAAGPAAAPRLLPVQQGIQVTMPSSIASGGTQGRSVGAAKDAVCEF